MTQELPAALAHTLILQHRLRHSYSGSSSEAFQSQLHNLLTTLDDHAIPALQAAVALSQSDDNARSFNTQTMQTRLSHDLDSYLSQILRCLGAAVITNDDSTLTALKEIYQRVDNARNHVKALIVDIALPLGADIPVGS